MAILGRDLLGVTIVVCQRGLQQQHHQILFSGLAVAS